MTQAELRERAPEGVPLTEYDREIAPIYLRLLDVPVPSIYGPSADENRVVPEPAAQ